MNKVQRLVTSIERVVSVVGNEAIKAEVGDSVSNNRTVTVGQLLRFLNNSASNRRKGLGAKVELVYTNRRIRNLLKATRKASQRTDAIDVNELLTTLRFVGEAYPLTFSNSL